MQGRNTLKICTASMIECVEQYLIREMRVDLAEQQVKVHKVSESGTRMAGMVDGFEIDFEVVPKS